MAPSTATRPDFVALIKNEFSRQMDLRLDVLKVSGIHLASPFDMNSDNMKRVSTFDVILPRRYEFTFGSVVYSDYRVFTENE